MKKPEINFDSIPRSALSVATLYICLKCAFDFFTKEMGFTARTAYSRLKRHVPEEVDFTGAATTRPHFFNVENLIRCPYCNGSKRWFAEYRATRMEAHPSFEAERKRLWSALEKESARFAVWKSDLTPRQIFSEWFERLMRKIDFEDDRWLIDIAIEYLRRFNPSFDLEEALSEGVSRVQSSRRMEGEWNYKAGRLSVSPELYGDILLVQYLLSRSHSRGGYTFKGGLALKELTGRLRRAGYFKAKGIDEGSPYELLERAVVSMVDKGPDAVYYAVDRSDYLNRLKTVYEKKREKK